MISVIIPYYNSWKTTISAIESINNQTTKVYMEVILVDDGSTDDSFARVNANIKNIKNIKNITYKNFTKQNGGAASARNFGINKSTQPWIALLDSDDIWEEKKIQLQIDAIEKNSEILFIGCHRNGEKYFYRRKDEVFSLELLHLLIKNYPQTSTVLIHRTILDEIGLYDENKRYCEDSDLWCRIARKYRIYVLNQSLVITGDGKKNYGQSGLSANLQAMHNGEMQTLRSTFQRKDINPLTYATLYIFTKLKYFKRFII